MNNRFQHLPCSDSPPDAPNQQNTHHYIHSQDPLYSIRDPRYGLYSNPSSDSAMHIRSDYSTDFDPKKSRQQHKLNGSGANNYRALFSSFPNTTRTRHQTPQSILGSGAYKDQASFPPGSADLYSQRLTSPTQAHTQPYDSRSGYDLGPSQRGLGSGTHSKPFFDDTYGAPLGMLPESHLNPAKRVVHQQQSRGGYSSYANDMQLYSQTPYNPHVPSSVTAGVGNPTGAGPAPAADVSASGPMNRAGGSSGQEEISTIFVVGLPDDMQEREFQNMFTFFPGFEAATLKLPTKEYTACGGVVGSARGYQRNDPYNIVTINQGGVVVDGRRDRTIPSWPAINDRSAGEPYIGGLGGPAAPRKQIIGFAKFRSREAALEARDMLQGRRVDIEKGAVLKAEMAKKNLHTKRGVGPVQVSSGPSANGTVGGGGGLPSALGNPSLLGGLQQGMMSSMTGGGEPYGLGSDIGENGLTPRERELGTLGALGLGMNAGRINHWLSSVESAEYEERERRRKERLRAGNQAAFNAFYSVLLGTASHSGLSRQLSSGNGSSASLLQPTMYSGSGLGSSPLLGNGLIRRIEQWELNTNNDTMSLQFPFPASGASSVGATAGLSRLSRLVDQNPPINTLYVGNLPTSPPASLPPDPDYLEECLRVLFSNHPGFRRLVFRRKNNGPMCFVEFEDVHYATKALNDLYGTTLNGLIKGGIRLSYSKNPLGVRAPNNSRSGTPPPTQQHMQGTSAQQGLEESPVQDGFQPLMHDQPRLHDGVPVDGANSNEGGPQQGMMGSATEGDEGLSMNAGLLGGARNFRIDNSHFTDITYNGLTDAVSAGTAVKVASLSAIAAASVTANVALYRELHREQSILEGTSKAKIHGVTPTDYSIGDPNNFMLDQYAYTTLSGVVDMLSGGESQSCSQINGTSGTTQHFLGGFAHLDIESIGDAPQVASTFSLLICITNAKFKFRKTRQTVQASSVVL